MKPLLTGRHTDWSVLHREAERGHSCPQQRVQFKPAHKTPHHVVSFCGLESPRSGPLRLITLTKT
jgi:hypothetical protein